MQEIYRYTYGITDIQGSKGRYSSQKGRSTTIYLEGGVYKEYYLPRMFFNYEKMKEENGGKQMKDVWTGALTKPSEKKEGKHPTQKPEYLLERIVLASTEEGQVILDPFCGSGTTGVEALRLGRKFIGVDVSEEYLQISKRRLEKTANDK